jgi:hypothetical protein
MTPTYFRPAVQVGLFFTAAVGIGFGCSSDSKNHTLEGNSSGSTNGGLTTGGVGLNGSNGSGSGGTFTTGGSETTCTSDDDCNGSQVCHPTSKVCVVTSGECSEQSDCGGGTACDSASGRCVPGLTGSPCASDANCDGAAMCTQGVCGCSGLANEQELLGGALDIYFIFDRTASIPVLICTYADVADADLHPADAVLRRPFSKEDLSVAVSRLLKRRAR